MSMSSNNDKSASAVTAAATPIVTNGAPAVTNVHPVGHVVAHANNGFNGLLRSAEREREREMQNHQLARYAINN